MPQRRAAPLAMPWEHVPPSVRVAFIRFKDRPWGQEAAAHDLEAMGLWNQRHSLGHTLRPPPNRGIHRHCPLPGGDEMRVEEGEHAEPTAQSWSGENSRRLTTDRHRLVPCLRPSSCSALPHRPVLTPHLGLLPSPPWAPRPLSHTRPLKSKGGCPRPGKQRLKKGKPLREFPWHPSPSHESGSLPITLFQATCRVTSHSPPGGQSQQARTQRGRGEGRGLADASGLPGTSLAWLESRGPTSLPLPKAFPQRRHLLLAEARAE